MKVLIALTLHYCGASTLLQRASLLAIGGLLMRAWLNVFLMAVICAAIFIVFMALRPAQAGRMLLPIVADDEELFERVRETTSSVRS